MYRCMQLAVGQTACTELSTLSRHVILYTSVIIEPETESFQWLYIMHSVFPIVVCYSVSYPLFAAGFNYESCGRNARQKKCWRDFPLVGLVLKGSHMIVRTIWVSSDDSFRA